MDMDEIPRWSEKSTVLLGDACHPVLPFGFSGASMAIEDATTLAVLLPEDVGVEQVRERLELYEKIRRPRVERVRESSRQIARGREEKQFIQEYRAFLAEHDTVECARQALEEHVEKQ
jgi:2-polyprenyl-6-methoxyphenol hydroxylase-like FAD-dependent oxidoreductase